MVNATSRPLYPRERPGTHCIGSWVGPRGGLDGYGKSLPTGIRSPDRPARKESVYRLSYLSTHHSTDAKCGVSLSRNFLYPDIDGFIIH